MIFIIIFKKTMKYIHNNIALKIEIKDYTRYHIFILCFMI